jgi:hypothetical protein
LSPELVEAILQGRQPVKLTATRLTELDLPLDRTEQHKRSAARICRGGPGGPQSAGREVQTLVLTDIATGWTEFAPLLVREQRLLTEVPSEIRKLLPFPLGRRREAELSCAARSVTRCSKPIGNSVRAFGRKTP